MQSLFYGVCNVCTRVAAIAFHPIRNLMPTISEQRIGNGLAGWFSTKVGKIGEKNELKYGGWGVREVTFDVMYDADVKLLAKVHAVDGLNRSTLVCSVQCIPRYRIHHRHKVARFDLSVIKANRYYIHMHTFYIIMYVEYSYSRHNWLIKW